MNGRIHAFLAALATAACAVLGTGASAAHAQAFPESAAIAARHVINAAPNGHALIFANVTELVINPLIISHLTYNPDRLVPVAYLGGVPSVLIGKKGLSSSNMPELLAAMAGGKLSLAVGGIGTQQHLVAEMMKNKTGVDFGLIPYQGSGPGLRDVMAGHVDLGFFTITGSLPHIQSGAVKAFAVTTGKRSELAPQIQAQGLIIDAGGQDFAKKKIQQEKAVLAEIVRAANIKAPN